MEQKRRKRGKKRKAEIKNLKIPFHIANKRQRYNHMHSKLWPKKQSTLAGTRDGGCEWMHEAQQKRAKLDSNAEERRKSGAAHYTQTLHASSMRI